MRRIIMHWSAGTYTVSGLDREHYHYIVDGDGAVVTGRFPVEANQVISRDRGYAAHTLNCNTGTIGVALAAMAGAIERPFKAGKFPITQDQLTAFTGLVYKLSVQYNIPITQETVLTHAEVQPTLGIKQRGKWDICWLPGMSASADPISVGNVLRRLIAAHKPSLATTILTKLGVIK
jgi:hypothetical protein